MLETTIGGQFAQPHGPLGWVAARIMRRSNAPLNHWIVELLSVGPEDHVLEVGFGPGVALAQLLEQAPNGVVTGFEASASMASQARVHFRSSIAQGRLEIHTGDAASLPFSEGSFDKVCATHVVYFWRDQLSTIRELRRVLRPGGVLALGYQERDRMPPQAVRSLTAAGASLVGPGEIEDLARRAGFEQVRVETRPGSGGPSGFCMLGTG